MESIMSLNFDKLADKLLKMEYSYLEGTKKITTTNGTRLRKLLIEEHKLAKSKNQAAKDKNKETLKNFYREFEKVIETELAELEKNGDTIYTEHVPLLLCAAIDKAIQNKVKQNFRYFTGTGIVLTLTTFFGVAIGMLLGHALIPFLHVFAFLTPVVGSLAPVAGVFVVAALFAALVFVTHLLITSLTAMMTKTGIKTDEVKNNGAFSQFREELRTRTKKNPFATLQQTVETQLATQPKIVTKQPRERLASAALTRPLDQKPPSPPESSATFSTNDQSINSETLSTQPKVSPSPFARV